MVRLPAGGERFELPFDCQLSAVERCMLVPQCVAALCGATGIGGIGAAACVCRAWRSAAAATLRAWTLLKYDRRMVLESLLRPAFIAILPTGALCVSDAGAGRLTCHGADVSPRAAIGSRLGELGAPMGVAVATLSPAALLAHAALARGAGAEEDTDIGGACCYVADQQRGRVVLLRLADGAIVGGSDEGVIELPCGIAVVEQPASGGEVVSSRDLIFVSDVARHRIVALDHALRFAFTFGSPGDGVDQFSEPAGVAVGGGQLIIADQANHRLSCHRLTGGRRWLHSIA